MALLPDKSINKFTLAGVIVALGIIYGDIGTSPLYVMQAIVAGRPISKLLVYGGLSCGRVTGPLPCKPSIKYVVLTLKADNKGEGGIFFVIRIGAPRGQNGWFTPQ